MGNSASHQRRVGYFTGPAVLRDASGENDLSHQIWIGPTAETGEQINLVSHTAKYALLVEKHTVFTYLVEQGFHQNNACILATGAGYPGTRFIKLLRQLHRQINVPLYVLADNDPAGFQFFFLIARGTARHRGEKRPDQSIPTARFLGIQTADVIRLNIPDSMKISLSKTEIDLLCDLRAKPWLRHAGVWQNELDGLLQHGFKVELESMCSIGYEFLGETFLPEQVAAGRFLEFPRHAP